MSKTVNSVCKIQIHCKTCLIHTITCIATLLCGTGSNVTGNQITECRITALEIIIAVFFRNLGSFYLMLPEFFHIFFLLWNPDTSIIA